MTCSIVPLMSSGLATVVDGVFVWQQAGEPQPLPLIEQPTSRATTRWRAPVLSLVGRAMIAVAVLACLGWSITAINSNTQIAPTTLAQALDPITTGSIKPMLRSTIGTDEDDRATALARASALTARQDQVGRRAIDMMCSECGISRFPGGASASTPSLDLRRR